MYIVGITGPSGAGKTMALLSLEKMGALPLDCDLIYHELLYSNEKMTAEIDSRFPGVLTDGKVDRKKLREIVFKDPAALSDLNAITHKFVWNALNLEISTFNKRGGEIVAIDAIALVESSFNEECDIVIGILAPKELRISRIMERDDLTREQAETRVSAQQDDSFYIENCEYILENTYEDQIEFAAKCDEFFSKLLGGYVWETAFSPSKQR
ncbi:MAG: dephospho-CoA kinase [Oscillospiraceae bacterium]|nr:dephospho-CoA kinase [Oscillospiraceae bacterium]